MENKINIAFNTGNIDDSHTDPTGDPSVGYPQISIRTNRTAQRTDLNAVINKANEIADQYPDDKQERAYKVLEVLSSMFGGGSFGHAWLIIFNSDKEGDYSSYAYHEQYGYVHNGDTDGHTNDNNTRKFSFQRIIPIGRNRIIFLENFIIPLLNAYSTHIGYAMGSSPGEGRSGVYTPLSNCSWFAGNVWKMVTSEEIDFKQPFPGKDYAERWGIDILNYVSSIADPGMIAESLSK